MNCLAFRYNFYCCHHVAMMSQWCHYEVTTLKTAWKPQFGLDLNPLLAHLELWYLLEVFALMLSACLHAWRHHDVTRTSSLSSWKPHFCLTWNALLAPLLAGSILTYWYHFADVTVTSVTSSWRHSDVFHPLTLLAPWYLLNVLLPIVITLPTLLWRHRDVIIHCDVIMTLPWRLLFPHTSSTSRTSVLAEHILTYCHHPTDVTMMSAWRHPSPLTSLCHCGQRCVPSQEICPSTLAAAPC